MEPQPPGPPPLSPAITGALPATTARLYQPGQVLLAAVLGSPIAAGWLLAQNFRRLGEPSRARRAFVVSVLVTLLMIAFGAAGAQEGGVRFFGMLLSLSCYQYAKTAQGRRVVMHQAAGGRPESWWRALGVGVAVMVALVVAYVLFALAADLFGVELPE